MQTFGALGAWVSHEALCGPSHDDVLPQEFARCFDDDQLEEDYGGTLPSTYDHEKYWAQEKLYWQQVLDMHEADTRAKTEAEPGATPVASRKIGGDAKGSEDASASVSAPPTPSVVSRSPSASSPRPGYNATFSVRV
eukprot:m.306382 g.306382  ORF g.306382 m.306382 type:complete len:137 (-) comp19621_c0_seq15:1362-1772(-)